jgi:hypothetical protein
MTVYLESSFDESIDRNNLVDVHLLEGRLEETKIIRQSAVVC